MIPAASGGSQGSTLAILFFLAHASLPTITPPPAPSRSTGKAPANGSAAFSVGAGKCLLLNLLPKLGNAAQAAGADRARHDAQAAVERAGTDPGLAVQAKDHSTQQIIKGFRRGWG